MYTSVNSLQKILNNSTTNKYIQIVLYHSYDELLIKTMSHIGYSKYLNKKDISVFYDNVQNWKNSVLNMYKLFDIKPKYITYEQKLFDICNFNKLVVKINTLIFTILRVLVKYTFNLLKFTIDARHDTTIVQIHRELYLLIKFTYESIDGYIQRDIEEKILSTRLKFSLRKENMCAVCNTNYNQLMFSTSISDLGYTSVKDIFTIIKTYINIHNNSSSHECMNDSYIHTSIASLISACIVRLNPLIDKLVYQYIQKFYTQLI